MKSFIDIFVEYAPEEDKTLAKRIANTLVSKGIDSEKKLINTFDDELYAMKGISDRSIRIIGIVKTKMLNKKHPVYSAPLDFKYFAMKTGSTYLNACQFEHILKQNGIDNFDIFLATTQEEYSQFKGIGAKRLQQIIEIKGMVKKAIEKRKRSLSK